MAKRMSLPRVLFRIEVRGDAMVAQRIAAARMALSVSIVIGCAYPSRAQVVEGEFGVGRVLHGEPAVPTVEIGIAVWPSAHWGVAARLVRGLGEDVRNPFVGGDRTFLGTTHLRLWTLTTRYRLRGVEVGAGFGSHRYDDIVILHFVDPYRPDAPMRQSVPVGWDASVTFEALYKHTLWRHFGIKAGVMCDAWFEGADYVRPVLLATVWP